LFIIKFNFHIELLLTRYKIIFTICAEVSCIVLVIIDSPPFDVAILVFCKGIVTSPIITIELKILSNNNITLTIIGKNLSKKNILTLTRRRWILQANSSKNLCIR